MLVSQAEYARRRGVSRPAVLKAVKSGRIVLIDGKIDPEVADIQWAKNTAPRVQADAPTRAAAIEPRETLPDAVEPVSLNEARARREAVMASLAELELAERRGELVSAAGVEKALASKILGARDALDALADRLSPLLAAESDASKVYAMLRREIRQALALLAAESRAPDAVQ